MPPRFNDAIYEFISEEFILPSFFFLLLLLYYRFDDRSDHLLEQIKKIKKTKNFVILLLFLFEYFTV
jgi:hypothetical protein